MYSITLVILGKEDESREGVKKYTRRREVQLNLKLLVLGVATYSNNWVWDMGTSRCGSARVDNISAT